MILESLPNEILLELFEFIDAVELFRTFHNLNSRFNTLLLIHFRAYRIKFSYQSGHQLNRFCRRHLLSIVDRVISLRLTNINYNILLQTDLFFSSGLLLNQFISLRSLSLCYVYPEEILRNVIVDCHELHRLTHLKVIACTSYYVESVDFSNSIWNLTKLTHCSLQMKDAYYWVPTIVSLSLEYFSISCRSWGISETIDLFRQTPCLQRLHTPLNELNDDYHRKLPSVSSMTILKLSDVKSSHAMMNILQAMPNLTHLKVDTFCINCDGYRWERIINDYLPKLQVFRFKMHIELPGKKNSEEHLNSLVDSFRTPFWLVKHQWFIRCHHSPGEYRMVIVLYTVPYAFGNGKMCLPTNTYKTTYPGDNDTGIVAN